MKNIGYLDVVLSLAILVSLTVGCQRHTGSASRWGDEMAEYVMEEYMPAGQYVWNWNEAVFLKAMVERCEQGGDAADLMRYVNICVDSTLNDANGKHPNAVVSGLATAYLAQTTGDSLYRAKAMDIYNDYLSIPRASNGGVSHRTEVVELWDDTVYMVSEYLMQMYKLTANAEYLDEAVSQLCRHAEKLEDPATGLWYHGWDNDTVPSQDPCCKYGWADNPDRRNSEFWGRGNGWIVMSLADLLELLPLDHPSRKELEHSLIKKLDTLAPLQDMSTGHWWQLPVYPGEKGNFIESSCTAMFAYAMAKASRLGIVDRERYAENIERAYEGLGRHSVGHRDGHIVMPNICEGTCIGDKEYYYGRKTVDERAYAFGVAIMFFDQYGLMNDPAEKL